MVLNPGTPENCGLLKTVMTDASWINTPVPLLALVKIDPASRSSPAFEFTDTPATGLPDALMAPPNDTRCAPDTTVSPVLRLSVALMVVAASLRKAFALVA